jgi:endoglucanase
MIRSAVFIGILMFPMAVRAEPPRGYRLAWEDNFEGNQLDLTKWNVSTRLRRGNHCSADAITVKDGLLSITTYTEGGKHYTGFLDTRRKFETAFGYFEARIRFRSSPGEWGAFWLHSPSIGRPLGDPAKAGTEIDIVEHRARDQRGTDVRDLLAMNLHWDGYKAGVHKHVGHTTRVPSGMPSLQGNWHTYALLWTPQEYRFYLDGQEQWRTDKAVSRRSEFLLLTCEIEDRGWAGNIPEGGYGSRAESQTQMDVDWVRVWQSETVANDGQEEQPPKSSPAVAGKERPWLPASAEKLPRWRGFNLLEKFNVGQAHQFREEDFRLIAKLGFNFVRLPMDYRCWIKNGDWEQFDEAALRDIDQAVAWGQRHGIHVCLSFHRAPGYTVARPAEKTSLWTDEKTQAVCARHWAMFARRYRGIPNERLSFNLLNEPAGAKPAAYVAVVRKLVQAIRAEDLERLIIADGWQYGNIPLPELRELRVAQATRGYSPFELTHYQASWANGGRFPLPQWPRKAGKGVQDREWLWKTSVVPWKELEAGGTGVMVGEWGAYNKTPHDVLLRWAEDCLGNWQKAGWGWALWNFRGAFGILDSGRADVPYEDFAGHKLDRKFLQLLQRY